MSVSERGAPIIPVLPCVSLGETLTFYWALGFLRRKGMIDMELEEEHETQVQYDYEPPGCAQGMKVEVEAR